MWTLELASLLLKLTMIVLAGKAVVSCPSKACTLRPDQTQLESLNAVGLVSYISRSSITPLTHWYLSHYYCRDTPPSSTAFAGSAGPHCVIIASRSPLLPRCSYCQSASLWPLLQGFSKGCHRASRPGFRGHFGFLKLGNDGRVSDAV